MAEHRSLDYAQARAQRVRRSAPSAHLAVFPDRPERDALLALADYVVSRDR